MYAIVTTGGKQFKLFEGDVFRTEKIDAPIGDTVELDAVTMLVKDDGIVVDAKALEGAKVVCQVMGQGRDRKIRIFKKKRRKNYARTQGHRQAYSELQVAQIVG
ncbi:MAG: 50S ribosomal protein L21 [Nitrospiraceae bacterium]|nr:50S ribosomal protein L21 [Nitrospiraceae bacterium]